MHVNRYEKELIFFRRPFLQLLKLRALISAILFSKFVLFFLVFSEVAFKLSNSLHTITVQTFMS